MMVDKELIELWKKEVIDRADEIDPGSELHWPSLAVGWAIAQGMSIDSALDWYDYPD